ncbi:MAG: hypothetical protein Q9162_007156 [Coniocarpon cinnabarinum]
MPQSTIAQWLKGSAKAARSQHAALDNPDTPPKPDDTFKIAAFESSQAVADQRSLSLRDSRPNASLSALPANVTISRCTEAHIKSFHRLNALLLPIQYPDSFYKETLQDKVIASITRVALWTPSDSLQNGNSIVRGLPQEANSDAKVVAAIRCRRLASPPHLAAANDPCLYISTIGTLSPFRRLSLASYLLDEIFAAATKEHGLTMVYAHVWEENKEGLEWYMKRGFNVIGTEHGYYQRLAPKTDAWLIERKIG